MLLEAHRIASALTASTVLNELIHVGAESSDVDAFKRESESTIPLRGRAVRHRLVHHWPWVASFPHPLNGLVADGPAQHGHAADEAAKQAEAQPEMPTNTGPSCCTTLGFDAGLLSPSASRCLFAVSACFGARRVTSRWRLSLTCFSIRPCRSSPHRPHA